MHKNIESYILDQPMTGTVMSKILANVIIKKGLVNVSEIWGSEVALYSAGLFAGTTDVIGLHNNKPSIIDFKNSLKEKKREWIDDYQAQLAAYALAHNEMYGTNIHRGVVMIATRDAKYQEFVFEGTDFDKSIDMWLSRLTQYYEKFPN
jgi:genome maintenance exonuclease 1